MISNMHDLSSLINDLGAKKGLVFRGHASAKWMLKPTLLRNDDGLKVDVHAQLERFRKYIIGKIDNIKEYSDSEVWAVGQHYGLKTPMLDWTVSVGVALFFALSEDSGSEEFSPILYALDAEKLNESYCRHIYREIEKIEPLVSEAFRKDLTNEGWKGKILIEGNQEQTVATNPISKAFGIVSKKTELERVRMFSPKRFFSGRIIGQRGLFTYSLSRLAIDEILQKQSQSDLLTRYMISPDLKSEALTFLDAMNVNYMTIYPDVSGAAQYANSKLRYYKKNTPVDNSSRYWL